MTDAIRQEKSHSRNWLPALLLAVCVAIAFAPTLGSAFIWDDDRYITGNLLLRTLGGLWRIWFHIGATVQYYPLTLSTFWIEYHLWGLWPAGYHLDNLLIQIASAILLWRALARLRIPGAWAAAAIWAVHPIQVESVAWATERKNVLSGLFYLLALTAWLNFEDTRRRRWYAACLALFAAALLSKTVTSTFPAVILLLIWWRRGKIQWREFLAVTPMIAAGLAMGALTGWMERRFVGAIGPEFTSLTHWNRACIAGLGFWLYLKTLLIPVRLSFMYTRWPLQKWMLILPAAALALLASLFFLRNKIGRAPVTAALFYAGTLIPALGFVNVFPMRYSWVSDHFAYLACAGPIVLAVGCLAGRVRREIAWAVIAVCVVSSYMRCGVYVDSETLWRSVLVDHPHSMIALNDLGGALLARGDLDEAEAKYRQLTVLYPADPAGWVGMGTCESARNNLPAAIDWFRQGLARTNQSDDPTLAAVTAPIWFNMGAAYQRWGKFPEAEAAYRQAVQLLPTYVDAMVNMANLDLTQGKMDQGIDWCNRALAADPNSPAAHSELGTALILQGKDDDAIQQSLQALALNPDDFAALENLGGLYSKHGDYDKAILVLQRAATLQPDNGDIQFELQNARLRQTLQKPPLP